MDCLIRIGLDWSDHGLDCMGWVDELVLREEADSAANFKPIFSHSESQLASMQVPAEIKRSAAHGKLSSTSKYTVREP